ncbi:hypothetical protein CG478_010245 [Bacillus cytotoxicus]|nr:hypothetical protein CG483_005010 [Bacillus cytotoxicus]AWC40830.1 hypothetical protein CG480_010245 [Bacillus cytotoxicus]AWC48761.1 hypothetical protein CG478_010245 [Bacillus cytotoxicus]AWC51860.1 hypothetical protein CG477_005005 [Bacillus cytotoxicus]AWC55989.1 hypothetical protein CG476_005005 [Bacillus cytotoxicus]
MVRHSLTIGVFFLISKFTVEEKIETGKRYLNGKESQKILQILPPLSFEHRFNRIHFTEKKRLKKLYIIHFLVSTRRTPLYE